MLGAALGTVQVLAVTDAQTLSCEELCVGIKKLVRCFIGMPHLLVS